MRRGRRLHATTTALTAALLLAACTGGSDPVVTPTATSSPTPTASPTPTPMALPTPAPEFAEPTPEGAIAAGTQFIALYDYAFATGDAGPLKAMSAEECSFCSSTLEEVRTMVEGGYGTEAEPMRVVASDSTEIREDEWFRVHLRVEQGAVATVMPDGHRQQTGDGGTVDFIFAMAWAGDRWRVEAVSLELVES